MNASPTRTRWIAFALAVCAVAAPRAASAEPAGSVQLVAGYSAIRDMSTRVTFTSGWSAGAAWSLTPWMSLVGDIDRETATRPVFDGSEFHLSSRAYLTGVRASGHLGVFTEFGQVLVGDVFSTGSVLGETSTTEHGALQPGLGLDYALAPRWSARGEFDVRLLDTGNELRAIAAIVFRAR